MQTQKQKKNLREYDEFLRVFHRKIDFYTNLLDQQYNASREISELRTKVQKKMSELRSETLEDELIKKMYLSSLENAREQAIILESRNKENEMLTSGSRKLWGEPSYQNYRKAIKILKRNEIPVETDGDLENDEMYDSVEMREWMNAVFDFFDISGWTVHLKKNAENISVSSANRKLNLPEDRSFSQQEAFRLALHEVGRHVLTFENGRDQNYKVMALGVGGYEKIDEGVAAYMEQKSGLMTEKVYRKYAARLIAVYQMNNGQNRQKTKENLEKLDIDPEIIQKVIKRVYTSGGLSRDHIYLEGLFRVENYLEEGGNLNNLFIGKVPLKYSEQLKERREIELPEREMKKLTKNFCDKIRPVWNEVMH